MSDWPSDSRTAAERETDELRAEIERLREELMHCHRTRKAHAGDLERIRDNFATLLRTYSTEHSLVAVSRIRKCLDGRYP